ncbi:hypothetical protein B0O99DRAFT_655393 [Bisporella sp. PMI_857]|nr:hypothetical protein B0O99DRAFT_655393 [Bisporella sp. PMI_857]
MGGDQRITVTHYAILIGIDAYPDRPSQGFMFTPTNSADPESINPTEDPILWPTYRNVTSALEKATTLAKAGDIPYIHYSDHGTRGDLALVLLNKRKEIDVRYLWGSRLALSLKAMVDKGLVVTLVLDCCFSASIYRRGVPSARFLLYDVKTDSEFLLDLEKGTEDGTGGIANREASMLPNWRMEAIERKFNGQVHGILSYFLPQTLKECGGHGKKRKDIYDHLRANFWRSAPQQNPVLCGNTSQGFFAHTKSEITASTIPIIEKQDGSLELQVGRAHGVSDCDRFALGPLGSAESNFDIREDLVIAKATQARALTSKLELLDTASIRVGTGWIAKPLTQFSLHRFAIRLVSSIPHQGKWLTARKGRSLNVCIDGDDQPSSFHVILNSNKEYEILDESDQRIINLPAMPFKPVRELAEKVEGPLRASFVVQIISRSGNIFSPGHLLEVEEDEEAEFMFELPVESKGNKNIYVHVYYVGIFWRIENILQYWQGFTGVLKKKLKTMVPAEIRKKGYRQCEDIIKVFITSQPTLFDSLELPKLGVSVKRNATNRAIRKEGDSSEEWAALNFPIRAFVK